MTRTVADNALMLDVIAGHDPIHPGSVAAPAGDYATGLERGVRLLRIGFIRHFHEEDMPADAEVRTALENVARTLQTLGAEIRDVSLPLLGEFAAINRVILQSEAWATRWRWLRERPGDYGQLARRRLMAGAFMSAGDYVQAGRRRLEMTVPSRARYVMSTSCSAPAQWTRPAASMTPQRSSAPTRGRRARRSMSPATPRSP